MPSIDHLIRAYGLIVVAGLAGFESVGLPVPGETVLIVASIIAGTERDPNIISVILTAGGASIIGRVIGYIIGREFGYRFLLRYGSYLWITESRIKLGQYLFLRHGGKIIILAQFVPVLRSIAGILAGANHMPWVRLIAASIIGIVFWATLYGLAAYSLGRQVERLSGWPVFVLAALVVILIVAAAAFVRRHEAQLITEAEKALPGPLRLR